jgi:hypothetical protein
MWTLEACPEHIEWRFETLLDSKELDAEARFVAIGGQAIGVKTAVAHSVVRLHTMTEESEP